MAQVNMVETSRPRRGVPRVKRSATKIDMTPMTDLGFLLVCFFVITTTLARPGVADLYMPKEGPPMSVADSKALTILLDKDNRILFYQGNWEQAQKRKALFYTGYDVKNGLGDVIRQQQRRLREEAGGKEGDEGLMLIIKATDKSSYKNLVDVLDETLINDIRHYAVVAITGTEKTYLETADAR